MIEVLPPALILFAGSVLIAVSRGAVRSGVVLLLPLLALWLVWQVPDGVSVSLSFMDQAIEPVEGSKLRRLFATIFALMTFVGGIYAFRHAKGVELAAAFAYAGGAIGVAFAGDLITLFIISQNLIDLKKTSAE